MVLGFCRNGQFFSIKIVCMLVLFLGTETFSTGHALKGCRSGFLSKISPSQDAKCNVCCFLKQKAVRTRCLKLMCPLPKYICKSEDSQKNPPSPERICEVCCLFGNTKSRNNCLKKRCRLGYGNYQCKQPSKSPTPSKASPNEAEQTTRISTISKLTDKRSTKMKPIPPGGVIGESLCRACCKISDPNEQSRCILRRCIQNFVCEP